MLVYYQPVSITLRIIEILQQSASPRGELVECPHVLDNVLQRLLLLNVHPVTNISLALPIIHHCGDSTPAPAPSLAPVLVLDMPSLCHCPPAPLSPCLLVSLSPGLSLAGLVGMCKKAALCGDLVRRMKILVFDAHRS